MDNVAIIIIVFLLVWVSSLFYEDHESIIIEKFTEPVDLDQRIKFDIFQNIVNVYAPYITNVTTVADVFNSKCYNNLDYFSYINSKEFKDLTFSINITSDSIIKNIQKQYIQNYLTSVHKYSTVDAVYQYYNNKINLTNCYYKLGEYLYDDKYDNMSYIDMMTELFLHENGIFKYEKSVSNDDKYGLILIVSEYLL